MQHATSMCWIVVTAMLALTGCGEKPEPGRIQFTGQGWPFSLVPPDGWERVDSPAFRVEVAFRSPPKDGDDRSRLVVVVAHEPWPYDKPAKEFAQRAIEGFPEGAKINKQSTTSVHRELAERVDYTVPMAGGSDRFVTYFMKYNDRGFAVSFATRSDLFEKHEAEMEAVFKTFRFEDK